MLADLGLGSGEACQVAVVCDRVLGGREELVEHDALWPDHERAGNSDRACVRFYGMPGIGWEPASVARAGRIPPDAGRPPKAGSGSAALLAGSRGTGRVRADLGGWGRPGHPSCRPAPKALPGLAPPQ